MVLGASTQKGFLMSTISNRSTLVSFASFSVEGYNPSAIEVNIASESLGDAKSTLKRIRKTTDKGITQRTRIMFAKAFRAFRWSLPTYDYSTPDTTNNVCRTYWGEGRPEYLTERSLHSFCLGITRDILASLGLIRGNPNRDRRYLSAFHRGTLLRLIGMGDSPIGEGKKYRADIGEAVAEIYNALHVYACDTLPRKNDRRLDANKRPSRLNKRSAVWHLVSTLAFRANDPVCNTLFIARADGLFWSKDTPYIESNNRRRNMYIMMHNAIKVGKGTSTAIIPVTYYVRDNNSHFMADHTTDWQRFIDNRDAMVKLWADIDGTLTDTERRVVEAVASHPNESREQTANRIGWGDIPTGPAAVTSVWQGIKRKIDSNPEYKNRLNTIRLGVDMLEV